MKPLDNLSFDLGYMGSSSFLLTSQSKECWIPQSHQAKRPTKIPKSPLGSGWSALSIAVGTVLTNAGRYSTAMKTEHFGKKNAVQLRRLENIYQCSIFFYCDGLTLLVQFQKASSQCQSNPLLGAIVPRRYFHLLLQKLHDLSISFKTQGKAGNLCLELLVFWQEII